MDDHREEEDYDKMKAAYFLKFLLEQYQKTDTSKVPGIIWRGQRFTKVAMEKFINEQFEWWYLRYQGRGKI